MGVFYISTIVKDKISNDQKVISCIWDKPQQKVIESSPNERILVDSGPGTGKTAVACARVAWLIDKAKILPGNIWMISFTRTAVREIRNRISSYLDNDGDVYDVKISTLDSHAWRLHSGYDDTAKIIGSYEDNIEKLLDLIRTNEDVAEYLKSVEHLIIDEAQDIVGIRADLIIEFIKNLSPSCGITIFADEAQAIYGFSVEDDVVEDDTGIYTVPQPTLVRRIDDNFKNFKKRRLINIYRTNSEGLLNIFSVTRNKVLSITDDPAIKIVDVKGDILQFADECNLPAIKDQELDGLDNCLVLYRKRADVLLASSYLRETPHRIRMSGVPHCIHPWIGVCFWDYTDTTVDYNYFIDTWNKRISNDYPDISADDAWDLLVRFAGKTATVVDIKRLRQQLGRGQPPVEFCYQEIGKSGPIIGTIHASKGREADEVRLMMLGSYGYYTDIDEETRVLFVGATRARHKLSVGPTFQMHFSDRTNLSKRVFSIEKDDNRYARIEIGKENDISAISMAGRVYYQKSQDVFDIQKYLCNLIDAEKSHIITAYKEKNTELNYRLILSDTGQTVGYLSKISLYTDIFSICTKIALIRKCESKRIPPDKLQYMYLFGIRTIILPPDSPDCQKLYEPWAKSGIMLAPIVHGYARAFFPLNIIT